MPKIYLLSRTLDPILGIFTGLLAYKLHETNPRSAPADGHTLGALLNWRWQLGKERRAERERLQDDGAGAVQAQHLGKATASAAAGAVGPDVARMGAKGQGQGKGEEEMWERMRRELEGDGKDAGGQAQEGVKPSIRK